MCRFEAHARPREALHVVPHQRFVDGADLLNVERLVTEPLSLEDDQLVEHAEERLVVN